LGDACDILPTRRHGHRNGQQSGYIYIIVLFAVALVATGAIWSKKLLDGGVQWLPV
jgi:hypothetical protein